MKTTPTIEDCRDFLAGNGPTNNLDKALLSKLSAQQLRAMAREAQRSMEQYLHERRMAKVLTKPVLTRKRLTPTAADESPLTKSVEESVRRRLKKSVITPKPLTPAPPARPHENDGTDKLVMLLRKKYATGTEAKAVADELARRGVTIHRKGYSISDKT